MDTNCIGYNVDVSGCSPEVIKAITQTLSRVKEDLQKVANTNKEENKKKDANKRWKPKFGENYFRIDSCDDIALLRWDNDIIDNKYYNFRNIYKTKEEAEFEVERRKVMIELQNYADEHNGETAHPSDAFWIKMTCQLLLKRSRTYHQSVLYCFLMQTQLTMQLKLLVKTEFLNICLELIQNICLELIQIKNCIATVIVNVAMNMIHGTRRMKINEEGSKI